MSYKLSSYKQPTSKTKPEPWAGGLARKKQNQKRSGPQGKDHSSTDEMFIERPTTLLPQVILTI